MYHFRVLSLANRKVSDLSSWRNWRSNMARITSSFKMAEYKENAGPTKLMSSQREHSTSALRSAIMVKTCVLGHCTIQMTEKAGISIHYIHLYNYRQPKAKKRRKL